MATELSFQIPTTLSFKEHTTTENTEKSRSKPNEINELQEMMEIFSKSKQSERTSGVYPCSTIVIKKRGNYLKKWNESE